MWPSREEQLEDYSEPCTMLFLKLNFEGQRTENSGFELTTNSANRHLLGHLEAGDAVLVRLAGPLAELRRGHRAASKTGHEIRI